MRIHAVDTIKAIIAADEFQAGPLKALLDTHPVWSEFRDQSHDLFITDIEKTDPFLIQDSTDNAISDIDSGIGWVIWIIFSGFNNSLRGIGTYAFMKIFPSISSIFPKKPSEARIKSSCFGSTGKRVSYSPETLYILEFVPMITAS